MNKYSKWKESEGKHKHTEKSILSFQALSSLANHTPKQGSKQPNQESNLPKNTIDRKKIPHAKSKSPLFFKQLSLNSSLVLKKTPLLSSEVQVRNKERSSKSLTRKKQTESPIIVRFCYIESSIQYLLLVSIHQKRELISGIKEVSKRLREIAQTHRPLFGGEIYLTGREVCERLFVSPRTLQDYRDKGIIPYTQIAGKILYCLSDINQLLQDNCRR